MVSYLEYSEPGGSIYISIDRKWLFRTTGGNIQHFRERALELKNYNSMGDLDSLLFYLVAKLPAFHLYIHPIEHEIFVLNYDITHLTGQLCTTLKQK